ncbi:unnamed protein product [Discosporangium mesarthrocarpum]
MPQFDRLSFFNQVFWLSLLLFFFYFFTVWYSLPLLAGSLKSRRKKEVLESNLKMNVQAELIRSRPLTKLDNVEVKVQSNSSVTLASGLKFFVI